MVFCQRFYCAVKSIDLCYDNGPTYGLIRSSEKTSYCTIRSEGGFALGTPLHNNWCVCIHICIYTGPWLFKVIGVLFVTLFFKFFMQTLYLTILSTQFSVICIDIVLNSCKGRMVNSVCVICIDIVSNSCKGKTVHSELLQYAEHVSEFFYIF